MRRAYGVVLGTLDGRDERLGAGGYYDRVGIELLYRLNSGLLAELELDSGLLGAIVEVDEPLGHLLLAGAGDSQVELTADLVVGFPDGDVVAALSRGDSGVHAAGAGADDEGLLDLLGRLLGVVVLMADARVDVAAALRMLRGAGDAASAAASAGSDVVKAVLIGLVAEVRVGEQGPAHAHAVHQAALDYVCGIADIVDLADNKDGDVDDLLYLAGLIDVHAYALAVAGQDVLQALVLHAAGDLEEVDAGSLELGREVEHLLQGVASLYALVAGDTQEDREIGADICAHLGYDLEDEAGAVVYAAAVLVHTLVAQRAQERAGHHVSVGAVQSYGAAAGLLHPAGGLAELLDDRVDLINGHRAGDVTVGVGIHARAQRGNAAEAADALRAGVNYLRNQRAAGVAHALGKVPELRDQVVRVEAGGLAYVLIFAVNGDGINHNVAGAALGAADEYIREPLGNGAVLSLVIHAHGGHAHAVVQRE